MIMSSKPRMESWIKSVLIIFSFILSAFGSEELGVSVTCGSQEIQVSFDKGSFPSLDASHLHLLDPSCKATETESHVFISTSLNGCGTTLLETEEDFVFSNVVYDYAEPIDTVITRENDFELPFKCNYSRKDIPNLNVLPTRRSLPPLERQGNLTFRFEIYRSSTYSSPHTSYPVRVTLNEDMYLRYSVESSADLVVMALNCKATNGSGFHSSPEYHIIQDGCPVDKTLEQSYDPYSSSQTFQLRAFRFLNDYDSFYLHCELLACDRDSEKSRCRQGCSPPEIWMKRQLKSVVDTTGPYTFKRGPIIFQEETENEAGDLLTHSTTMGSTTFAHGFASAAVLVVTVLAAFYCISRSLLSTNKPPDLRSTKNDQMIRRYARPEVQLFTYGGLHQNVMTPWKGRHKVTVRSEGIYPFAMKEN